MRSLRYRASDFNNAVSVARVVRLAASNGTSGDDDSAPGFDRAAQPVAAYLALPSAVFAKSVKALGEVGLPTAASAILIVASAGGEAGPERLLDALIGAGVFFD